MTKQDAVRYALEKGATLDDIEREIERQRRTRGTVPHRNMVRALQMHPWNNSRDDWVRLAAALSRVSSSHLRPAGLGVRQHKHTEIRT